jgi:hypothetical protein
MSIPADFQFTQGNLQDFVECARRFQLRCIERRAWPAVQAEPALESERLMHQGLAFHRMVQQHLLGIDAERLSLMAHDEDLDRWWRNYLAEPPADLPPVRHPELVISAPLAGYRLVAKIDLLAVDAGPRIVIVDWKTSRRRPARHWLFQRLQTRVYPYLLVRAAAEVVEDRQIHPRSVEMVYWFANFPTEPERFQYDEAQYAADGTLLLSLIEGIVERDTDDFPRTEQIERCTYCRYRSLCERGQAAGLLRELPDHIDDTSDDLELDLDFEDIAEIGF